MSSELILNAFGLGPVTTYAVAPSRDGMSLRTQAERRLEWTNTEIDALERQIKSLRDDKAFLCRLLDVSSDGKTASA